LVGDNPGTAVSRKLVVGLFRAAYIRRETIEKAENAVAATGIYPHRPNIISDEDSKHGRPRAEIRFLIIIWKRLKMNIQMLTDPILSIILISLRLHHHELLMVYHQKGLVTLT
jgi:hypothetical protein